MDNSDILSEVRLIVVEKESDANWQKKFKLVKFLTDKVKEASPGPIPELFDSQAIKTLTVSSILSERSKLSIAALNLVETLAFTFKEGFRSVSDTYLSPVLRLSSRAKRVYVTLSRATLIGAIESSTCHSFIPRMCEVLSSPSKSLRETVAIGIATTCKCCKGEDIKSYKHEIEKFIRVASLDQLKQVRECSKSVWEEYKRIFPDTHTNFENHLSFASKKCLSVPTKSLNSSNTTEQMCSQKNVRPKQSRRLVRTPSTLTSSASSVGFSLRSETTSHSAESEFTLSSTRSLIKSFKQIKTDSKDQHAFSDTKKAIQTSASCGIPFRVVRPRSAMK